MEELMNYGNNLIEFLKEEKDAVGLKHFLRHAEASQSQLAKHFNEVQKSIEGYLLPLMPFFLIIIENMTILAYFNVFSGNPFCIRIKPFCIISWAVVN